MPFLLCCLYSLMPLALSDRIGLRLRHPAVSESVAGIGDGGRWAWGCLTESLRREAWSHGADNRDVLWRSCMPHTVPRRWRCLSNRRSDVTPRGRYAE